MNNYITLTKVILKSGMNLSSTSLNRKKNGQLKKPMNSIATWIISLVVMIPLMYVMINIGKQLYSAFATEGNTGEAFSMICSLGSYMVLVFAIPYVLSVFFMSSDLESLLPLPVKPSQILAAKFTSVAIYEYMIVAIMFAPLLVGFGIAAGAGIGFWVIAICAIILLPFTPLVYASILAIGMMRLLKKVKNKEMITTASTFLIMFVVMGFSMSIGAFSGTSAYGNSAELTNGLVGKTGGLSTAGMLFPNSKLLVDALTNSNFGMLLLYLASVVALMAVFLLIAEKIYFSGVMGMSEGTSKRKKLTSKQFDSVTRAHYPRTTYMKKDLKTLFRSPEYFANCLMMPILFPLIMLVATGIPLITSLKKENVASTEFNALLSQASPSKDGIVAIFLLVIFGLCIMIGGMNSTSCTCISREGKGYVYMKCIPMSYKDQLVAKARGCLLVSVVSAAPYVIILSVLAVVLLRVNISVLLTAPLVAIATLTWCDYFMLWFDLHSPKLNWDSEQAAVKQNFNTFIATMAAMVIGAVLATGSAFFFKAVPLPSTAKIAILIAVLVALCIGTREAVLAYGVKKLEQLEQ